MTSTKPQINYILTQQRREITEKKIRATKFRELQSGWINGNKNRPRQNLKK